MSRSIIERLHDAQSFAYQGNSRILGLDRDIFAQVTEVKFTVYYCLIGIAQALKEVPQDLLDSEPNVPWGSILGMRNRLIQPTGGLMMTSSMTWRPWNCPRLMRRCNE